MLKHFPHSPYLSHICCWTSFLSYTLLPPSSSLRLFYPPSLSLTFFISLLSTYSPSSPLDTLLILYTIPPSLSPFLLPLLTPPLTLPFTLLPFTLPPSFFLYPSFFPLCIRAVGEKESLEFRLTELGTLIASMEGAARTHSQRTNRSVRLKFSLYPCSCSCICFCSSVHLFFLSPPFSKSKPKSATSFSISFSSVYSSLNFIFHPPLFCLVIVDTIPALPMPCSGNTSYAPSPISVTVGKLINKFNTSHTHHSPLPFLSTASPLSLLCL